MIYNYIRLKSDFWVILKLLEKIESPYQGIEHELR